MGAMKHYHKRKRGIAIILFAVLVISFFLSWYGTRVDSRYFTYRKTIWGIYYISVKHSLELFELGSYAYLHNVDRNTFEVLADNWAKDKNHVWHTYDLLENVDVETFKIDKTGLAKDKTHVYVSNGYDNYHPLLGVDAETAEYFVFNHSGQYSWIRDKDHVFFEEKVIDVDRNTFRPLGNSHWWIDKDWVYMDSWNSEKQHNVFAKVDSLQYPLDTLVAGSHYLRNGRNIIFFSQVIAKDIDVWRFYDVGVGSCIVNDMLFKDGKQILKDTLDVDNARFYYYGHIVADKRHVFYGNKQLDGIDAPSFCQTNDNTFEDKNYIYTIKDGAWEKDYPFDKQKKK